MMSSRAVYSVYDSKANGFLQPFYSENDATAVRSFQAAVNTEGHDFKRFAEDYTLFKLGDFIEETGEFLQPDTPQPVVKGIALLEPEVPTMTGRANGQGEELVDGA